MRILITGGAGFIGSHLCDVLLELGHQVICMDNLLTGNPENIAHLIGNSNFKFISYDVSNYIYIEGKIDAVLHFASPASPKDYLELPIHTLKVGAFGTHKTLGLAKEKGARFLLASTSEVYGDPLMNPQSEEYWGNVNPISPRGVYDEAKRFAEAMTMAYHRYHGLDTRIVRIFNTFGPRMREDDGRAISNFIVQALKERPLTVYGDGSQTRSFCYIDDMVDGIIKALFKKSDKTFKERTNRENFLYKTKKVYRNSVHDPMNLGNPYELSILDIAKMVLSLTRSKSKIEFRPLPSDDPRVRRPDISKASELLQWEPKVGIEEALKRTIKYFRTKLGIERMQRTMRGVLLRIEEDKAQLP